MSPTSAYPELPDNTAGTTGELVPDVKIEARRDYESTTDVPTGNPQTAGEIETVYDQSTNVQEARDAVRAAFETDEPQTVVRESERAMDPGEMLETVVTAGNNIDHARNYELAA